MGRTLVWQVRSSEKEPGRTLIWSLGSELGERNGPNPGSAGLEFGERTFFSLFCFLLLFLLFPFFFLYFSFLVFFLFFFFFFLLLFFFIFFSFFSEFGLVLSPNSEPAEPRFGPVPSLNSKRAGVWSSEKGTGLLRTRTCQIRDGAGSLSELRTCQGSKIGERNLPFSEHAEPGFRPSSYCELRTCQGSEFRERNWLFSEI